MENKDKKTIETDEKIEQPEKQAPVKDETAKGEVEKQASETPELKPEGETVEKTEDIETTETPEQVSETEQAPESIDTESVENLIKDVATLTQKVEADLYDTKFIPTEQDTPKELGAAENQQTENKTENKQDIENIDTKPELSDEEKQKFWNRELYKQY